MTPLLLLDVDGVLNALPDSSDDLLVWPDWHSGWATADGSRWHITWSPTVVRQLRDWHESGAVELQWLTTWGHDANGELRELLGLPELAVAGTYDEPEAPRTPTVSGAAHASVTPAAPDPLTGRWWKYDVVQRVLRHQPGRVIMWVDDELHRPTRFRTWAEAQERVVPVGPNPRCGLTESDLIHVAAVVSSRSDSADLMTASSGPLSSASVTAPKERHP